MHLWIPLDCHCPSQLVYPGSLDALPFTWDRIPGRVSCGTPLTHPPGIGFRAAFYWDSLVSLVAFGLFVSILLTALWVLTGISLP